MAIFSQKNKESGDITASEALEKFAETYTHEEMSAALQEAGYIKKSEHEKEEIAALNKVANEAVDEVKSVLSLCVLADESAESALHIFDEGMSDTEAREYLMNRKASVAERESITSTVSAGAGGEKNPVLAEAMSRRDAWFGKVLNPVVEDAYRGAKGGA